MVDTTPAYGTNVAIIGYAFKFPGLKTEDDFFNLLAEKRVLSRDMAEAGRFDPSMFDPLLHGNGDPMKIKPHRGAVFEGDEFTEFDSAFFGFTNREVSFMDPDQRALLECSWKCLEKGGIDALSLHRTFTGVIFGSQESSFVTFQKDFGTEYQMTGVSNAIMTARVSHYYGLHGPSIVCNTACASTLTAVHIGVRALEAKECEMCFVGGVNSLYSLQAWQGFSQLGVLSSDGLCKSFDQSADGYSRGEGSGVFLLKPLEAAKRDHNRIFGVIRGTLCNSAGPARGAPLGQPGRSLTTPSVDGQVYLLRNTYLRSGVPFDRVSYIEAHGTGTLLGDQMECNAISEAFAPFRTKPLRISSAKSNMGHLEGGSGVVCLAKCLVMFKHQRYLPVATCENPTTRVDWNAGKLRVQLTVDPFDPEDRPVTVGCNNFGFGGSNVHVIVQEYIPEPLPPEPARPVTDKAPAVVLPLAAKHTKAFATLAEQYAQIDAPIRDLAGNQACYRTPMSLRRAFVSDNIEDLRSQLLAFSAALNAGQKNDAGRYETCNESKEPRIGYVFSGQGTQWEGCGRRLYTMEPVFKAACDKVDELFVALSGWSLVDKMFHATQAEMDECQLAQPLNFIIQVGLIELLKSWGIFPAVVCGHSAGEVAAVYASGYLSLEDATFVIYHRSRLQQTTTGSGRLLALGLSEPDAREIIEGTPGTELGAWNGPSSTVLTGNVEALREVEQECNKKGIFARFVRGSIAFHSRAMEAIEEGTYENMAGLGDRAKTITTPIISTVTGAFEFQFDEFYWYQNMRQTVMFAKAMETMLSLSGKEHIDYIVELGPHPALRAGIESCIQTYQAARGDKSTVLNSMSRGADDTHSMMKLIATLWEGGARVNWKHLYNEIFEWADNHHVELPGYPFQVENVANRSVQPFFWARQGPLYHGPLLGRQLWTNDRTFEFPLTSLSFPYLLGHVVQGVPIVPAAGYLEMVMQAVMPRVDTPYRGRFPIHFTDVQFEKTLVLKPYRFVSELPVNETPYVQVILQESVASRLGTDPIPFIIISNTDKTVQHKKDVHARGFVSWGPAAEKQLDDSAKNIPEDTLEQFLKQSDTAVFQGASTEDFYDRLSENWGYKDAFRVSDRLWYSSAENKYLSRINLPEEVFDGFRQMGYHYHPAMLDGVLQIFGIEESRFTPHLTTIPRTLGSFHFFAEPASHVIYAKYSCHIRKNEEGMVAVQQGIVDVGDVDVFGEDGKVIACLRKYHCHSTANEGEMPRSQYFFHWQPKSFPVALPTSETSPLQPRCCGSQPCGANALAQQFAREALTALHIFPDFSPEAAARAGIPENMLPYARALSDLAHAAEVVETPACIQGRDVLEMIRAQGAILGDVLLGKNPGVIGPDYAVRKDFFSSGSFAGIIDAAITFIRHHLALPTPVMDTGANRASRRIRVLEITRNGDCSATNKINELLKVEPQEELKIADEPPMEYYLAFKPTSPNDLATLIPDFKDRPLHLRHVPIDLATFAPGQLNHLIYAGQFDMIVMMNPTAVSSSLNLTTYQVLENIRPLLAPGGLLLLFQPNIAPWAQFLAGPLLSYVPETAEAHKANLDRPTLQLEVQTSLIPSRCFSTICARAEPGLLIPAPVAQKTGCRPAYIVFEESRLTHRIVEHAHAEGAYVVIVRRADVSAATVTPQGENTSIVTIRKTEFADDLNLVLAEAGHGKNVSNGRNLVGVYYLWPVEDPSEFKVDSYSFLLEMSRSFIDLSNAGTMSAFPIWVVTEAGQLGGNQPEQGCMIGLTRTLGNEVAPASHTQYCLVDLPAGFDAGIYADHLWTFSRAGYREEEVALREGEILVPRLNRLPDLRKSTRPLFGDSEQSFWLPQPEDGQLASLQFRDKIITPPTKGETLVQVHASALNFRDLMVVQDLLPPLSYERSSLGRTVGMECAGRVLAIGPDTEAEYQVGDEVVSFGAGCLANKVKVPSNLVFRKPRNLSLEQSSAILSVYMTTYYALIYLAHMKAGDRVLIHAALGGIGLCAISICKSVGAIWYGTAGTPEKRQRLVDMGAAGVFDSRHESWAEELRESVGAVDIVLNSLAGRHIDLGIQSLRPGGRFCEIGKRDIYEDKAITLLPFRKNISYHAIDLDRLVVDDPELAIFFAKTVIKNIEDGIYDPLPITTFPMNNIQAPLRLMQKGGHTGKLVMVNSPTPAVAPRTRAEARAAGAVDVLVRPRFFEENATYICTGGLGGFGLAMMRWFAARGARNIAIMEFDRRDKQEVRAMIQEMRERGVSIKIYFGDVSKKEEVAAMMRQIASENPVIKGIFHLAGVLRDATVLKQDRALYWPVVRPKAQGAWNLHNVSVEMGLQLDYFYMASSIASVIGSHSQANYAASNCYLDSLAAYRRRLGLAGSIFNMGVISDTGMALRDPLVRKALKATGVESMYTSQAFDLITAQHYHGMYQTVGFLYNWSITPETRGWTLYSHLCKVDSSNQSSGINMASFKFEDILRIIVAQAQLLTGNADVDPKQPLTRYGLDSFMGTELSVWLQKKFQVRVSQLEILTSGTCLSLARAVINHYASQTGGAVASSATSGDSHGEADGQAEAAPVDKTPTQFLAALPKRA